MATTGAEAIHRLAVVRRLEAAGFRAFPAASTTYDGTWAVRLTAGFPAKRLNSVNPLDPSDHGDVEARIERARRRFGEAGRPFVFRLSPLAPRPLVEHLDAGGWRSFGESIVLTADLATLDLAVVVERLPVRDPARYVAASLAVHERSETWRAGFAAVVASIQPPTAFFVQEAGRGEPIAVALGVHDNDLAGILDLAVAPGWRRQGIGRDLAANVLRYAMLKGVRTAWLQVEADNAAGLDLYGGLGFAEAYRYSYRAPPDGLAQMR